MPDTIREQIVQTFTDRIGATRCLKLDGSADLPAKSVWDYTEEAEVTGYGAVVAELPLAVSYLAKTDSQTYANHSIQANAMLGELIQLATAGDNTLGGLCRNITYTSSEIEYPEDGAQEIEIYCAFTVSYSFAIGDPFTIA